ncbi:trypsin-like serine peptidase [Frigidibacter oleivorans]|uniref:trypsin-like serine peptidase n=1 Tax=Frigidibacter oleivorans TaxID=2487129 RepID=UPI000F8DCCE3|nr:trypsin-like peptidase domain-containing protein [Frigidibacter oleivorans]
MIRRLTRPLCLSILLCLGLAQASGAQDSQLHSLLTADDSRGWDAVGRIDLAGRGFCTGALIAPDLVLTAAHCLFDKTTGQAFAASEIRFLAGWRGGRAAAYRDVRRALPHPGYVNRGGGDIGRVGQDLALLELTQPIRLPSIAPFETDLLPRPGDAVGVVSYALDRSEAPSLQDMCHVLDEQDQILVLSCSVDFGASGAPIFTFAGGRPRIVSVVSAKAEVEGQPVSLGTSLAGPLTELRAAMAGTGLPSGGRVLRPGAGQGEGAKFIRP